MGMTLDEAYEEQYLIYKLHTEDPKTAAAYLHRLVSEAYAAGWDAAFDTAPDNFKPVPRQTKFRIQRAT